MACSHVRHVSTESTLARAHESTQITLSHEHINKQGTLAREQVSKQGTMAWEHIFRIQSKQFTRVFFILMELLNFWCSISVAQFCLKDKHKNGKAGL